MAGLLFETIRKNGPLLSVGALSADIMHLAESISVLEQCNATLLHFDIMDNHFCPQLTAGPFFTKAITTSLFKDVHLMVEDPLPLIPEFAAAGADLITVHAESGRFVHRALQLIAEQKNVNDPARGILRGVALNPGTPLSVLDPLLGETDIVFFIAINPGFAKQKMAPDTGRRLSEARILAHKLGRDILFGIDGGITCDTIKQAAAWRPDVIVSGSAIFEGGRIPENITFLNATMRKGYGS